MAEKQTLTLKNGSGTDDLKFYMEVDGVIESNGTGKITDNVADDEKEYEFKGKIEKFNVVRGAGSAYINGNQKSFSDLEGYSTPGYGTYLRIDGRNSGTNYTIDADTLIGRGGLGGEDTVTNSTHAEGYVGGGTDEYEYTGNRKVVLDNGDGAVVSIKKPGDTSFHRLKPNGGDEGGGEKPEPTPAPQPTPSQPSTGWGSPLAEPDPNYGKVARRYSTQRDTIVHVGRGRQFESLQAAFNDVPHYINHDYTILVHGRTRDNGSAHLSNVSMANEPHFVVKGVGNNAVINNGGINLHISGKMDHIEVINLEFEDICQCIKGRWEDCLFAPNGSGSACFSGKDSGKMLIRCEFKPGADYSIVSIGSETVEIRGCTLRGNKAAVDAHSASQHVFTGRNVNHAPDWVHGGSGRVYYGGERVA